MGEKTTKVDNYKNKIYTKIEKFIKRGNTDSALALIAGLAYMEYEFNQRYIDERLEGYITKLADDMIKATPDLARNKEVVLFYDAFGLNTRGLALIYVKALCSKYKVLYVTNAEYLVNIPDIKKVVESGGGYICGLTQTSRTLKILELFDIVEKYKPANLFMYTLPDDVVSTSVFAKYLGIATRYQINLTDHAFWLGSKVCDYCLEFRDYGGYISREYRGIQEERIIKLPYYPIIDYDQPFEGYPFPDEEAEFIFSGGSLYKTISEDDRYYHIVEYIMSTYPKVFFWYAGNGDGYDYKIRNLQEKFPERVYWTAERKDLYQILKRCLFYLNTYPMVGGLMMQYAAMAGKVPVTIKYDACSDGIFFEQENLQVEFKSDSDVKEEIDKLYNDLTYREKKAKTLGEAVITPDGFENQLVQIIETHKSNYKIAYNYIEVESFQKNYYARFNSGHLNRYIARGDSKKLFCYMPLRYFGGAVYKIWSRKLKKS